jgi:hypothetical protein
VLRKFRRRDGVARHEEDAREEPRRPTQALVPAGAPEQRPIGTGGGVGWDFSAQRPTALALRDPSPSREPQVLALLADPRVDFLTIESVSQALSVPPQDVETLLASMRQAGTLVASGGVVTRFSVPVETKAELEAEFRASAPELGEHVLLARIDNEEAALAPFEDEEPRLPATAGLLSLFLPGTGQLLNGDIGRASLVFAVWSLAWITNLSPVWTFVCLYAGAEAFFTAKIRGMERKLQEERLAAGSGPDPKKLPSPGMT